MQFGLATLCEPVEGNFLNMPFEESSFDGAYAIEATCHAPKVQGVGVYTRISKGALPLIQLCPSVRLVDVPCCMLWQFPNWKQPPQSTMSPM